MSDADVNIEPGEENGAIVFERTLDLRYGDEWFEGEASHLRVQLTLNEVNRLNVLAEAALKINCDAITDYFFGAVYGVDDDGEFRQCEEMRTECDRVVVMTMSGEVKVYWKAYIRHTDVRICTDWISLTEINNESGEEKAAA